MSTEIIEVLSGLDPEDDEQWTQDGLPRLDLFPPQTKRQDVTDAAPNFTRENFDLTVKKEEEEEGEETLEQQIADVENEIRAAQEELDSLERKVEKLRRNQDKLIELQAKNGDPAHLKTMKDIQRYQQTQDEIRRQRVEAYQRMAGQVPPGMLAHGGKAPIDAAMRRKTGFGHDRPQRGENKS